MARLLLLCLLMLAPLSAVAAPVAVKAIRTWVSPDQTRVVLDVSDSVAHNVFTLKDPHRVVVDLEKAALDAGVAEQIQAQGVIQRVRSGQRGEDGVRIVLDLESLATVKSFLIRPSGQYGHRLVLDLQSSANKAPAPVKKAPDEPQALVIAIDAGHGGEDPGAIGPAGTYEKHVVLGVARKLAQLIEKEPGMQPVLIRTGDYYVDLRGRTRKAREARADIFISLHADSVAHRGASGSSVYTLSARGASTETARLLADRENAADLIGGVSLEDKDDQLATVLLDLSRAATIEASVALAGSILGRLDSVGKLHKTGVEQAGFAVLKSLDMPSVLVELAFISNPAEERRLKSNDHQWRLARSILAGLQDYRDKHMPQRRMAEAQRREHVVRSGDTLSGIASRYAVSLDALRSVNALAGDTIPVGQRLLIP